MASQSRVVSVGTNPTVLSADGQQKYRAPNVRNVVSSLIMVPVGGQTVYLGGPDVTTANGFPLVAGGTVSPELVDGSDTLYGVVATGSQQVNVLSTGV